MEDGTVYEIVNMSSCDTSATEPSGLPLSNGFDLTGRTADEAFLLTLIRAGFDDDNAIFSGALEGDFDENGKNSTMLYTAQEETLDLTADGRNVAGTIAVRAIGPTRPHGDESVMTIDVRC